MTADAIHATVVVIVVTCATALTAAGVLSGHDAGLVYTTAVGYAAGRSGTRAPGDNTP